jgi:hypothetical protein
MFDKKILSALMLACLVGVAGCKQELPKAVEADSVFGTVQDLRTTSDEKQLVYTSGEDPYTKNWGLAGGYYVTVDGKQYMVHWENAEAFKQLKAGDKVNLHPTEYITCTGETDLKPTCFRLMKIYKSERRVNPIQQVQ